MAVNITIVVVVLAIMAAVHFIPVAGLIGGVIGYVGVQAWARWRYGDR